jgi:putative ABC transport system substrate-binding protein
MRWWRFVAQLYRPHTALWVPLFVTLALAPLRGEAQPSDRLARIGFLQSYPSANDLRFEAFRKQLRELGYTEGKTVEIEYLSAEGKYDRLPSLAAKLARRNVNVIVADGGTPSALAAMKATRTIPIVFCCVTNPVEQGMVASFARPGGNVTGITNQNADFAPKSLELLKQMLPSAKRIAILSNPTNPSLALVIDEVRTTASRLGLEVTTAHASAPEEFERAFRGISKTHPAAVLVLQDPMMTTASAQLATLAAKHRLPIAGGNIALPEHGGLMSYGPNLIDLVRRAAILVDKILKGAKPSDLPVEQPTKFELVINLGTAKALSLKIPQSVLVRADQVVR